MRARRNYEGDNVRMLNKSALCAYIGMGETCAVKFARDVGAEKRIGRRCLYDVHILDKAIDQLKQA